VYLQATPLLFLTFTLLVYQGAYRIYRSADFHPLLSPVALSIVANSSCCRSRPSP